MFVLTNRHFRAGAPPIINPINTSFSNSTEFSLAYNLTVSVRNAQAISTTLFNVTQPEAGDWFIAAHLPKDDGKIQQQVHTNVHFLLAVTLLTFIIGHFVCCNIRGTKMFLKSLYYHVTITELLLWEP